MQSRKPENNVKGIDVSHWQGKIDWKDVRSDGIEFVYIKASEGSTIKDPNVESNYNAAKQAGLKVGFYHFGHPSQSATKEVKWFLSVISHFNNDLPHVLDIEQKENLDKTDVTNYCEQWLSTIKDLTGKDPILYTYVSFAKENFNNSLSKWPIWIAHYGVDTPENIGIWEKWSIFQYTNTGSVKGVEGKVDMDEMDRSFYNTLFSELGESDDSISKCKYILPKGIIKRGDISEDVQKVQEALASVYFYPDKNAQQHGVDGVFGPNTEDAVRRFQEVYIPKQVDGIFGPNTRGQLKSLIQSRGCQVL
ncbi:GH25 family lysozyme [Cytobacillus sp. IB215316]|uniref:GH25 family lysozyme n=1 Tax=Cytobacillus sp. IB215316 TaxID=3097354 RepID=UPI002A0E9A2F|nr:GH25 family lysozyme [Cytobacillus sp. IB215316]MDX8362980.1 GH25 family lysozyme [Cytobacillus sp. IB215316]